MTEINKKTAAENINKNPVPDENEITSHAITMANGETILALGNKPPDTGLSLAVELEKQFPNHLVLIRAGEFLHAFNKSAYFLNRMKNFKLTIAGDEFNPHIRAGFPVRNSKRRLWRIMQDFQVPFVVALGTKATGYKLFHSEKYTEKASILNEIQDDIVHQVIADLGQESAVTRARAAQLLLKQDVTFRLKQVAQNLYSHCITDLSRMPKDYRSSIGKDIHDTISAILRNVFLYSRTKSRGDLLSLLSGEVDLIKHLLTEAFRLKLFHEEKFNFRAGLAVELGKITGGLLERYQNA